LNDKARQDKLPDFGDREEIAQCIHLVGNSGGGPVNWAAGDGRKKIIRTLKELGADLAMVDRYGWTPMHRAAFEGKLQAVKLLKELGAPTSPKAKNGQTPFDLARYTDKDALAELGLNPGLVASKVERLHEHLEPLKSPRRVETRHVDMSDI